MLLVTTISYDDFSSLLKERAIYLNNSDLFFGEDYDIIHNYLTERVGCKGYVLGIRGNINSKTVNILSKLDSSLNGCRLIIEANVSDDEVVAFNVNGIDAAAKCIFYGLPDECVIEQMDSSVVNPFEDSSAEIVCVPCITKSDVLRITSTHATIRVDVDSIKFVKPKGEVNK